jgi:hypothetical protein
MQLLESFISLFCRSFPPIHKVASVGFEGSIWFQGSGLEDRVVGKWIKYLLIITVKTGTRISKKKFAKSKIAIQVDDVDTSHW